MACWQSQTLYILCVLSLPHGWEHHVAANGLESCGMLLGKPSPCEPQLSSEPNAHPQCTRKPHLLTSANDGMHHETS